MRRLRRHTAKKASLAAGLSLSLSLAALTSVATPVLADPVAQIPTAGAVVGLAGTPHLWIADSLGTLHWAGDTRALSGKNVQWGNRSQVSLDQLRAMHRGEPWLSTGLMKSGDPIYFVKWESNELAPQLLQIQNISDVELFGINGGNYGEMILDLAAWEQRYGLSAATLVKGTLPAATGTVTPAPAPAPLTLTAVRTEQSYNGSEAVHEVVISGAKSGTRLQVSGEYDVTMNGESLMGTFGPEDAGPVNSEGKLTWRRTHPSYTGARYTFTDPAGNTVKVVFPGDPA